MIIGPQSGRMVCPAHHSLMHKCICFKRNQFNWTFQQKQCYTTSQWSCGKVMFSRLSINMPGILSCRGGWVFMPGPRPFLGVVVCLKCTLHFDVTVLSSCVVAHLDFVIFTLWFLHYENAAESRMPSHTSWVGISGSGYTKGGGWYTKGYTRGSKYTMSMEVGIPGAGVGIL